MISVPKLSRAPPRKEPLSIDARMANNPSHEAKEREPDDADLTNESDNSILAARYSSKPTSFDTDDIQEGDIEDGLVKERDRTKRRRDWTTFWHNMTFRRKGTLDAVYEDIPVADGLLQNVNTPRRTRRKINWKPCIAGSFSALTILAIPLALFITSLFSSSKIDPSKPENWGKPGTGTEGLAWYPNELTRDIVPIRCHSHNDYWRKVPLFSAILTGCTGVEADVWLLDNELYVGHNEASLRKNRTFQSLYVNPIMKILEHQNTPTDFFNGTIEGVYEEHPAQTLTLLVDLKTEGAETWPLVVKQLQPLRDRGWLSFVDNGKVQRRPVTIVGSGNAPFDLLTENSTYRDCFFDAPLDTMWEPAHGQTRRNSEVEENRAVATKDLGQGRSGITTGAQFNKQNSYYASASFKSAVGKILGGKLSEKQLDVIRGQVRGARKRGLKARYWDTPAWPLGLRNYVWDVLVREGVYLLNVDDLRGASEVVW